MRGMVDLYPVDLQGDVRFAVQVVMAPPAQVEELCGEFPEYLPKDQSARVVTIYENTSCPWYCNGDNLEC